MHAGTERPLLQDITFKVPAKKLGLIYGRSGAGKTTLLQLIAGLTTPTSGSISVTETAGALCTVRVLYQAFQDNEAQPVADRDMLCHVDPT